MLLCVEFPIAHVEIYMYNIGESRGVVEPTGESRGVVEPTGESRGVVEPTGESRGVVEPIGDRILPYSNIPSNLNNHYSRPY